MAKILHLLTRPDDALPQAIIRSQQNAPDHEVEVVDLSQAEPDYPRLIEQIFAADSIATW